MRGIDRRLVRAEASTEAGRTKPSTTWKFISEVADEATPKRHRLDPATAALWIAEARSIIAALMTT
jgi:hypothetical protein